MTLPKKNRLNKNSFKKQKRGGRTYSGKFLTFKPQNTGTGPKKFAVVASSKVVKKSTERNLLKRRVKEIIRKELKKNPNISSGIFYLKNEIKNTPFKKIKGEVLSLLRKTEEAG